MDVFPPQGNFNQQSQTSGSPLAYPSLADQFFGELDSGSRGARQSIFDSPQALDIVNHQLLTERAPSDMGQALEQSVGVMIQRTGRGQSSPFIRGLTGPQVVILVDGVRMTNATFRAGPNQYFNTIDPNMVDHIEVLRGSGATLYGGDALGGVINVVTQKASITGYDSLTGGTIQRFSSADLGYTGRITVEGSVSSLGAIGGYGYGNYNNLDIGGNPDAPVGFTAGRQPATSWRYNSADLKLNYAIADTSEVIFAAQHYEGEDIFRTDRFPSNRESVFDPQQRDLYYIRLQGFDPCGPITTYQLTASLHDFTEVRADRDFRPNANPLLTSYRGFTDQQEGFTASFTTDMQHFGTLSYGMDYYEDDIDSFRVDVNDAVNPATFSNRAGEVPNDADYRRRGAYLQWDAWLTDRLLLSTGARHENVKAGATVTVQNVSQRIDPEYHDTFGNIGLTYEVNPWVHLVGNISEGFRAPNIDDLATVNENVFVGVQLPNPDLDPEYSLTYEAGIKLDTDRLHGQAFYWTSDIDNYIDRGAPNTFLLLDRTNTQARLEGVELAGEWLYDCHWSVYGNFWYTYGQNEFRNEPLDRIPPTQGILGLRRRWNQGNEWFDVFAWIAGTQDRISARDLADTNRIPPGGTPGYQTLNFRYGRMIARGQRLSLNLENIFDEQYRVHGSGSDAPGINAILTYELLR